MKKLLVVAAVALIVFITGIVAMAATNTLTVNGTVTGTCKFVTATSTLSFTLDPSSEENATATASPTFWCTRGASYTATSGQGLNYLVKNRMKSTGTPEELIKYSLALTPSSGTGLGPQTPIILLVTGTVLNADYINAMALSDYTDTVVLTVLP